MKKAEEKDKLLRDLIEICHFTERVTTRIHGLLDKTEVFRTVREQFRRSKRYAGSILLLTDDGSKLRIAESSLSPERLKAVEKVIGLRVKGYEFDLKKSSFYSQVIREGKTVQANVIDVLGELFPRPVANLLSKTMGCEKEHVVLTPLKWHGKVMGAFAMSFTDLSENLIPPVRNLVQHVSAALALADKEAERKRAEAELSRSQERYRQFVENLHEGIWVIDRDAYTTFVNARMAEMLGYTIDEMLGKHLFSFMDEYGVQIATRNLERRKRGIKEQHDFEFLRKDGTLVYTIIETSPITDDKGNFIGAIAGVQDITQRKRVEEELQKSEKRYRLLADNAADVIWTVDMNMRLTYISPSITRLLGCSVEEAMAKPMEEVFTPASFEVAMKALAEELAREKMAQKDLFRSRVLEFELNRKDGSIVPVEISYSFLRGADAQPVEILAVARDITERKRMEEALQESERHYRLLADNVTDIIWTMDMNLRYTYVSPSVTRLSGYSVEEATGQTLQEVLTPASFAVAMKAFAEEIVLENMEEKDLTRSRMMELELNRKDGSTFWAEVTVTALRDQDGQPVGFVGVARDITERKDVEELKKSKGTNKRPVK